MKITIKGEDVTLRYTFRSMMMFENITNNTFNPQGISDIITLFYCIVVSSNRDLALSFDEFLDWLDDNQSKFADFGKWLQSVTKENEGVKKK